MKDDIATHEEVRARRTERFSKMLLQVTNDLAKTKSLDEALETLVNITTSSIGASVAWLGTWAPTAWAPGSGSNGTARWWAIPASACGLGARGRAR